MSTLVKCADGTVAITYADGSTITLRRGEQWPDNTPEKKSTGSLMKEEQGESSDEESFDEDLEIRRNG
jgi:hypothetical protein